MLDKTFSPKDVEGRIYAQWQAAGAFRAGNRPDAEPFAIMIPPPNITGRLHIGHALNNTLQDILARFERMRGKDVLWQPGTDHAGIATQLIVERQLAERQMNRVGLGREKFLAEIWKWKAESGGAIVEQLRRLGASADWSRERFTMDEGLSRAVAKVFVELYRQGLIYKDKRLVNWDPRLETAVSDLEVENIEIRGHLWHIRYPIDDLPGQFITIATTRPETMLGDTAVAVHPDDERYKALVGKKAVLPLTGRLVPIIADEHSDPEKGTGAVKITPAHDFNDFEIGKRHKLAMINIFHKNATLNDDVPAPYRGLSREAARKKIVADLDAAGLLADTQSITHAVPHDEKTKTVVLEPMLTEQWYLDVAPLAAKAIAAVEKGETKFVPENWTNVFYGWMRNIRPWCISRQIWWGHQVPIWYDTDGKIYCAETEAEAKAQAGGKALTRDPDVLDTWFSSGLWPFTTLGWPEDTEDLRRFYPTSVMETGYDILFFWVARMIMMGLEMTGEIPFHTVYLHGLIRVGREKMSKVKGNVLNPLELIEDFGTDALRLSLVSGTTPGNDTQISTEKLEANRNFVNKLWNAGRFVMSNVERWPFPNPASGLAPAPGASSVADRWIVSRANDVTAEATRLLREFQLGEAAREVHDFLWGEFCDWYVEIAKIELREATSDSERAAIQTNLAWVFEHTLRLLHPMMPFVTEELWQTLLSAAAIDGVRPSPSIVIAPWPDSGGERDLTALSQMEAVIDIVRAVRNLRAEYRVDPGRWVPATIVAGDNFETMRSMASIIGDLPGCRLRPVEVVRELTEPMEHTVTIVAGGVATYVPLAGMVDVAQEVERLEREAAEVSAEIARAEGLLARPGFVDKARPDVVAREREKVVTLADRLRRLQERLDALGA